MPLLHDFYTGSLDGAPGDFSIAELSACALDGDVSRVEFAFVLSDIPEGWVSRARIILSRVDERCVVAGWSAAWVHSAVPCAPEQHTVALRDGLRIRLAPELRYSIAQMSFEPVDVTGTLGAFVTSPLRTAIDLARFSAADKRLRDSLIFLLRAAKATSQDVHDVLERVNNLPYKQRAYRRLAAALESVDQAEGYPSLTR